MNKNLSYHQIKLFYILKKDIVFTILAIEIKFLLYISFYNVIVTILKRRKQ